MRHCPKCDAIYQPHWTRCLIGVAVLVVIVLVGAVVAGIGPFGESDSEEASDRGTVVATTGATPESNKPDRAAPTSAADSWIDYTSPEGDFSVEFPSGPTVEVQEFDAGGGVLMRQTDYLSYDENDRYMLSHLEPVDPTRVPPEDTETMFARAAADFLEFAAGEPHEERGETAGYPSVSFGSANNGISDETVVLAAGAEYFSLRVAGVTELIDVPRYFESFRVVD